MDTNAIPEELEALLGQFPEIALLLTEKGDISWTNNSAANMLQIIRGDDIFSIVDPGSKAMLVRSIEKVWRGEDIAAEMALATNAGPVLCSVHMCKYVSLLVFLAHESSGDSHRFLSISAMLSQLSSLARESSRQIAELEQQRQMLRNLSKLLDDERRRLRTLIDQLPEGIVLVNDDSGDINLTNLRIAELWNFKSAPARVDELQLTRPDGSPVASSELPLFRAIHSRAEEGPEGFLIPAVNDVDAPVYVQALARPILDQEQNVIGAAMSIVDVSEQKRLLDKLANHAVQDPLTGLGNRRMFFHHVSKLLEARQYPGNAAVLYIDLDGFRVVNDTLGHEAGDIALAEIATRLKHAVRDDDIIARIGGDEFAILLHPVASNEQVETIVRRILEYLSTPMDIHGQTIRLPASVGIALATDQDSISTAEFVRRADLAMYQAKATGASRWAYYDELARDPARAPLRITDEIHEALDTEQFEMLYQPVIDLQTGKVCQVEIALFWRHLSDGLLGDIEIRRRAWQAGLLYSIAERAADLAEHDRPLLLESLGSQEQFVMSRQYWIEYLREERVVDQIVAIAQDVANTPIRATMELSGRLEPSDTSMLETLTRLHNADIGLSLARAGEHDGDISMLRHLPIESIVASEDLVRSAMHEDRAALLLKSIIATARSFDIPAKAPGITHPEMLRRVRELGFDLGSGPLISPPLTAIELLDFSIDRIFFVSGPPER